MFEVPSMPERARPHVVRGGIVLRLRVGNRLVEAGPVFASFLEPVSRAGFLFAYAFPSIQDRNAG